MHGKNLSLWHKDTAKSKKCPGRFWGFELCLYGIRELAPTTSWSFIWISDLEWTTLAYIINISVPACQHVNTAINIWWFSPYFLLSKAAIALLSSSILALILSISSSLTNFGPWIRNEKFPVNKPSPTYWQGQTKTRKPESSFNHRSPPTPTTHPAPNST